MCDAVFAQRKIHCVWFQASVAMQLRAALFRVITQRVVAISSRSFGGKPVGPHLRESRTLKGFGFLAFRNRTDRLYRKAISFLDP